MCQIQGLKTRIGPGGPTGWTCNRTTIRSDLAEESLAPSALHWTGWNRLNRCWPARTGNDPGWPVYASHFLVEPCLHRCWTKRRKTYSSPNAKRKTHNPKSLTHQKRKTHSIFLSRRSAEDDEELKMMKPKMMKDNSPKMMKMIQRKWETIQWFGYEDDEVKEVESEKAWTFDQKKRRLELSSVCGFVICVMLGSAPPMWVRKEEKRNRWKEGERYII